MVNILIAEDDATSRKILSYILTRFDGVVVKEVQNGEEAVAECMQTRYDIVFMDINMPIMDGIEATRQIRIFDSQVLIVAISGDNDEGIIRTIIKTGAEDYISKPINADILRSRIAGYLLIVEHRSFTFQDAKPINLFDDEIFNYAGVYKINSESDLILFWECYCGGQYLQKELEEAIYGGVAAIFKIGEVLLRLKKKYLIFVEHSEDNFYFTVTGVADVNNHMIEEIILKETKDCKSKFLIAKDKLSLSIERLRMEPVDNVPVVAPIAKAEAQIQEVVVPQTSTQPQEPQKLYIYDFIEDEDMLDLRDLLGDLESTMSVLQYSSLTPIEVVHIADIVQKIAVILGGYHESYDISLALRSLGLDIKENVERFVEKSRALSGLFIAFSEDLKIWQESLFVNGAPSENFLDATIIANASTVANLIKPPVVEDDSAIGDIFAF